ncbi:MAG: DUF2961 domain-containing protein [Phycisphaeraceae bacterium]|nr:MAG: DUF2961 domain-containing protein [Phycisphaeraceae bacterium]
MPSRQFVAAVLTLLFALPANAAKADESEVSLQSLLTEMIDRDAIARWPDPPYTCTQFSSYDRQSTSPDDPATWFANGDNNQFIRTEPHADRVEHVMMDADGPGAIVRFWATWSVPQPREYPDGTLRIYLDNAGTPTIEGRISDILDRGALVGPPLGDSVSPLTPYAYRGHNLYLPIPYEKHCKVTYTNERDIPLGERGCDILYYQINYRTYPARSPVRTFSADQLNELAPLIDTVQQTLRSAGSLPNDMETLQAHATDLRAGSPLTVIATGTKAIRELTVHLDAPDLGQALRSTILQISFDGEPSVWCPVGDFFGTGHRLSPHQTWPSTVKADGTLTARWTMPFGALCTIHLLNVGDQPVDARVEAHTSPWTWNERSMYFHATWHELNHVHTRTNADATHGAFDVNFVTVRGRGVYAGDSLTIFNGSHSWWGEGDEKVFVDGERFPSHIGTGTEDYYGYAWSNPNAFDSPFHAQPCGRGANDIDMAVNNRYRLLDGIPFTTMLKFDMELWHWAECTMNYAPTTFWYALPGARVNIRPDPEAAALPVIKDRDQIAPVYRVPGAIEGESLAYTANTHGVVESQPGPPQWHWSGEQQLWWRNGAPGDTLSLTLPVDKAGQYRVFANLTKAIDYAIVRLTINGQPVANELDRFNDGVASDEIDLGAFDLKKGDNTVKVEIAGANPSAVKAYMFGLDYIRLEPAS